MQHLRLSCRKLLSKNLLPPLDKYLIHCIYTWVLEEKELNNCLKYTRKTEWPWSTLCKPLGESSC